MKEQTLKEKIASAEAELMKTTGKKVILATEYEDRKYAYMIKGHDRGDQTEYGIYFTVPETDEERLQQEMKESGGIKRVWKKYLGKKPLQERIQRIYFQDYEQLLKAKAYDQGQWTRYPEEYLQALKELTKKSRTDDWKTIPYSH